MSYDRYWLYEWIDNVGIDSYSQAERLLKDPVAVADLRERAASEPYTTERLPPSDAATILAGRAIDLSGNLDCLGWDCIERNVDGLFNRIWHYFDRIVVVGASAHKISREFGDKGEVSIHLRTYIRLLLYLREIGGESLLLFRQKPPDCTEHLEEHLEEIGIQEFEKEAESAVPSLASKGIIKTTVHDNHTHYAFSHPEFEHTVWGSIDGDTHRNLPEAVARTVVRRYLAALVSDLRTARILDCPLGSSVRFHERLLATKSPMFGAQDVAFRLELPVVQGLDLRTLLKLRTDEKPAFDRFRRALSTALKGKLSASGHGDPRRVAKEIHKEILEPALSDIESRLKGTTDSFRKKTGVAMAIYGVPVIFGLHATNPFYVATGLSAAAKIASSVNSAAQKYIEERRDVSMSDMFFLWKAQRHAVKRAA